MQTTSMLNHGSSKPKPGRVILLNGASSAGKTSIGKALQGMLDETFLRGGIDNFWTMIPEKYVAFDPPEGHPAFQGLYVRTLKEGEHVSLELNPGPVFLKLIRGIHQSVAALAAAGNNVIFDDVMYYPEYVKSYAEVLQDVEVLFVGVRLPLELSEQREKARGDRALGHTRWHHDLVHWHGLYDMEVDTSTTRPEDCARQIMRRLYDGPRPTAMAELRKRFFGTEG
jgi:chloramphenicol 3-O phosphotransferase